MDKHEFGLAYYKELFDKRGKNVFVLAALSVILAAGATFFQPVSYVSTVTLLSAETQPSFGEVGRVLGLQTGSSGFEKVIITLLESKRIANDIRKEFNYEKNPFRWKLGIFSITSGLGIEVRTQDPALSEKIANFVVQDLDRINSELNITAARPIVKVLDPAVYGAPVGKKYLIKMALAGIFAFLASNLAFIALDILKKPKTS